MPIRAASFWKKIGSILSPKTSGDGVELDGTFEIKKVDPEVKLTDTGNSEYSRLTRTDTDNEMTLYNRALDTSGLWTPAQLSSRS